MIRLLPLPVVLLLVGCASGLGQSVGTYTCPNGPDFAVNSNDDSATIAYTDGRTETLPKAGENLYAKPGLVWQITGFRSSRLTEGQNSYHCDQMNG